MMRTKGKWSFTGLWSFADGRLKGAKAKHCGYCFSILHVQTPVYGQLSQDPRPLEKKMHFFHERKSIYMISPENSTLCFFCGLGQTLSVQTHDECPSGAGVYKGTGVALVNV